MITVRLWPAGTEIRVEKGTKLSKALLDMGIPLPVDCGQHGKCGKCAVWIVEKEEKRKIPACTFPVTDDVTVLWSDREHVDGEHVDGEYTDGEPVYRQNTGDRHIEHIAGEAANGQKRCGEYADGAVAAAVDLGTTTVAASLISLEDGECLGYEKHLNPQRRFGADVISRMEYGLASPEQFLYLCRMIRQEIYRMLQKMMNKNRLSPEQLRSVVVVGNPVMTHLFCGLSLKGLARAPFHSELENGYRAYLKELDMERYPEAVCYVPPTLGGHVGSDFYACIVAKKFMHYPGAALLLDIGTNGEMGLCRDGSVTVTSTAAGPAFEGTGIRQGMTAVEGAICQASWNAESGKWDTVVVGEVPAKGICGSGLIDVAAGLFSGGMMDKTGYLKENPVRITGSGMQGVRLWQEDIRSLQMAKSAIRSGLETLVENDGSMPDVLMLCGDFANALNIRNAKAIGLLPDRSGRIEICGNQALAGAEQLCRMSEEAQEKLAQEAKERIHHMELADSVCFQEQFIKNMDF